MALACGHTPANRGSISVAVGRKWAIQASGSDCWISISDTPDVLLNDFRFSLIKAGVFYIEYIQAASGPMFLSALSMDPNADVTPTQITFIDSGASGI